MPTYDGLVVRIIDALMVGEQSTVGGFPRSVTRTDVQNEVQRAIEFYSTTRFHFNEGSGTITTSSSLAAYNWPADLLEIESVTASVSGSRYPLRQIGFEEIDAKDSGKAFGQPYEFAVWAEQLRLYPIPNATYTLVVSYQKRLPTISVTSDSNAWTTIAEDLISSRVVSRLCTWKFRDFERAAIFEQIEMRELARLIQQNEKTASSGRLAPND